jgi:hypothetical protein
MVGSSKEERTTTSRVIIAIVIALGLLGVVAVTIVTIQIAEARGCSGTTPAANASKGRCFRP